MTKKRHRIWTCSRRDVAAFPLAAALQFAIFREAAADSLPLVGLLLWGEDSAETRRGTIAPIIAGMADGGVVEGTDYRLSVKFAGRNMERGIRLAKTLEAEGARILIAASTPAVIAAKRAGPSLPLVIAAAADPVGNGIVSNLSRPGGNVTGMSFSGPELAGKRLELMREILPNMRTVGFLGSTADPASKLFESETRMAAQRLGVQSASLLVGDNDDFAPAFDTFSKSAVDALIVQPIFVGRRAAIAALAAARNLPWTSDFREFAVAGAPFTYGADLMALLRQAGFQYAARIFRGEKPGDIPVQEPSTFQLVVNLRAARRFSMNIPETVLARADEVID